LPRLRPRKTIVIPQGNFFHAAKCLLDIRLDECLKSGELTRFMFALRTMAMNCHMLVLKKRKVLLS
jgi:hypothetical protein